jgi:hypothetical protein
MPSLLRNNLVYYVVLLFAHIGLVWTLPFFPTQDGPSHVYNLVILHDLLNGGKSWGDFFTFELHAVPNLGFNLIAYPLLGIYPPFTVEKIFLSVYMVLMGVSIPCFLRVFGSAPFPFSYLVFPVIFNFALLKGFYSYALAVPLFLLACALSWKVRDKSLVTKAIICNVNAIVLFYFHLLPFFFYLLFLAAVAIALTEGVKQKSYSLAGLLFILSPVLANLVIYLNKGAESFRSDFDYAMTPIRFNNLIGDLFLFSTVNFSPWQLLPGVLLMAAIIKCGYQPIKNLCQQWLKGEHVAPEAKVLLLTNFFLLCVYFFHYGVYFNQRFPWVIMIILLPLLRMPETTFLKRHGQAIIVVIVTIFFVIDAGVMWQQSSKVETFLSGLRVGLPKGAQVLTYRRYKGEWSRVDVLLHAVSYYGVLAGCVDMGNYETGLYQFPIRFQPTLGRVPTPKQASYAPETIDWDEHPSVRFLFGWELEKRDRQQLGKFFQPIWVKGAFSLWERKPGTW